MPPHHDPTEPSHASEPEVIPIRWGLQGALFVLATLTTWLAGITFAEGDPFALATWRDPGLLLRGASYSLAVMPIIFAHEMGHYLKARQHRVPVSAPYFLPGVAFPGLGVIPLMGTFGAFIKMQLRPLSAKKLLEIGAWGPLAGFIVAIPVLLVGYSLSEVRALPPVEATQGVLQLGNSLLFTALQHAFFGTLEPGRDVFLHPVAMAGWTGCFLTAFNLLPLGQLDGGHIMYSVFGERFNRVAPVLFAGLIVMGIVAFPGWLILAGLIAFMRPTHPDIIVGDTVGRGQGLWLVIASVAMFILTFTPRPLIGPTLLDWALEVLNLG